MKRYQRGFTLSELLIALLGVIAAFVFPKVLQTTGNSENYTKGKEAVSIIEDAWYNQKLTGNYHTGLSASAANGVGYTLYDNIIPVLNFTATGTGQYTQDALSRGQLPQSPCDSSALPGWVKFSDGIVISGLAPQAPGIPPIPANLNTSDGPGTNTSLLCLDVNGEANGPNEPGVDVFYANFNPTGDFVAGTLPSANAQNFFFGSGSAGIGNVYAAGSVQPFDGTGTDDLVILLNDGMGSAIAQNNGNTSSGSIATGTGCGGGHGASCLFNSPTGVSYLNTSSGNTTTGQ